MTPPTRIGRDGLAGRDVATMFDGIAGRYDLLNRLLSLGIDRRWRRQACRAALEEAPRRVLDVATGTGDMALGLSRGSAEVIGVDVARAMLERARAKAQRARAAPRFLHADGQALPFPDGGFDALTIAYGLRNFTDPDAGLREFQRVLRPGGRLVVLEFPPPPRGPLGRVMRAYFRHVLPRVGGLVSGDAEAYRYLPESVLAFAEPEALTRRMRAAGFINVEHRPQTFGVSALYVARAGNKEEPS